MIFKSKKLSKITNISHAFFSKKGGISSGIYKSLNCGLGSNDDRKNVIKNLNIIKKKFQIRELNLLNQIHSNKIIDLTARNKNLKIGTADGIFTSIEKSLLAILTADCIPILFSSRCGNYICAIHGGWKGLYKNIIKSSIMLFKKYKIKKQHIICAIGPSIDQKSYEVKIKFMNKILKKNKKYKKLFKIKKNKIFFDIKKYAYEKLIEENLPRNNIEIINIDTYANPDLFFSHRRSVHKKEHDYGRNISIIVKKKLPYENNFLFK